MRAYLANPHNRIESHAILDNAKVIWLEMPTRVPSSSTKYASRMFHSSDITPNCELLPYTAAGHAHQSRTAVPDGTSLTSRGKKRFAGSGIDPLYAAHRAARTPESRLGVHLRGSRLQPGASTPAARDGDTSGPAESQLIGRWRIIRPICGIAPIFISPAWPPSRSAKTGWAELAFGAVEATAQLEYGCTLVFFGWSGFDEGDQISGGGSAELQDDGT
jgi:hypothetical protein